jgi:hypothetical protein
MSATITLRHDQLLGAGGGDAVRWLWMLAATRERSEVADYGVGRVHVEGGDLAGELITVTRLAT